jgi:hypothetical protein
MVDRFSTLTSKTDTASEVEALERKVQSQIERHRELHHALVNELYKRRETEGKLAAEVDRNAKLEAENQQLRSTVAELLAELQQYRIVSGQYAAPTSPTLRRQSIATNSASSTLASILPTPTRSFDPVDPMPDDQVLELTTSTTTTTTTAAAKSNTADTSGATQNDESTTLRLDLDSIDNALEFEPSATLQMELNEEEMDIILGMEELINEKKR